jgi:GlcNAc-P-P-Und epimerase
MEDKILFTGGSGFIGSHFYNALPHDRIINLDLNKPFFAHQSNYVPGDIRVAKDIEHAIQSHRVNTVISLAAKHHDFGIGHDEYFDTNEDGTRQLCKVASAKGINRIIFYSSVAVYGWNDEVTTEETTPNPASPYGASKLAGENVLRQWAAEDPSRTVIVIRPTVVYGANNVGNMYNLIRQIDSGLYFHIGEADNIKSIAYVENLVKATLFINSKVTTGFHIFNYADEPQLTSRQIANIIAAALNKKIRITLPPFLINVIGWPFDLAIKITGKNLPVSTVRMKKLNTQTYHAAAKIISEGFKPQHTTIDGLRKMVEWYKKTRGIKKERSKQ